MTAEATPGTAGAPATKVEPKRGRASTVRRARLMVTRFDPWSVLKTSFMLTISFAIILLVAVAILWWILDQLSVFDALSRTVNDIAGSGTTQFDLRSVLSFGRVMGAALVVSSVEVVLVSVVATLFAFMYNLSVGVTGGVEVVLSDQI